MEHNSEDERYMRRCLQLAANGLLNARPNPMVGAVIVCDGRIIGEGYHVRCGEGHAEVNAFASVRPEDEHLLSRATIYVSLEPCAHYGKTPPCAELIIRKGVRRVVVGSIDPNEKVYGRGIEMLRNAGIEVTTDVLGKECRLLNRRFFSFQARKRPYTIIKWAQSADGFIDDHFKPARISNQYTMMLNHKLRAENEAIIVGRVTAERDQPKLNVRLWSGPDPIRRTLCKEYNIGHLLKEIREKEIQSLIVEGGAKTHEFFFRMHWWDEIRVETSPIIFGDGTKAAQLPNDAELSERHVYGSNVISVYRKRYETLFI